MQLERIEDLLDIQHEKLKVADTKRLLTKIKQLLKEATSKPKSTICMPYQAISVVGNKLVTIDFDLESGEARITNIEIDPRDIRGRNIMAGSKALSVIDALIKNQKEIE